MRLLLLTDRRQCPGPLDETVARAVDGGARTVVVREHDLEPAARHALADRLRETGATVYLDGIDYPGTFCHRQDEIPEGAPFVTLSPIFPTRSKPGYGPPLGLAALARICVATRVPVYALGGVDTPERARECLAEGAHGIAVMGVVMRSPDPARTVKEMLSA